ncbi:MAG: RCC1 domain-containing protein [Candidatus Dormibacteria bacterium]
MMLASRRPKHGWTILLTPVLLAGTFGLAPVRFVHAAATGSAYAWGNDDQGELGDGRFTDNFSPAAVRGARAYTAISGGMLFFTALRPDGTVAAWGDNAFGELGNGNTNNSAVPVTVPGATGVIAISSGGYHTLALRSDGTVLAWGWNAGGDNGQSSGYSTPAAPVPGLNNVVKVVAGWYHSLAIRSDGTVWTWGSNDYGQLGNGSTDGPNSYAFHATPTQVAGITTAIDAAGGSLSTYVLLADGSVVAWGYNSVGELGDGTQVAHYLPAPVPGLTGVAEVTAGNEFAVARLSDGTAQAWGYDAYAQLGRGAFSSNNCGCQPNPASVQGLVNATAISSNGETTMALLSDGTVRAWGYNFDYWHNQYGFLGTGSSAGDVVSPQAVIGASSITAIAAGRGAEAAIGPQVAPNVDAFQMSAVPDSIHAGDTISFTASPVDDTGAPQAYSGSGHLSSSDSRATLSADSPVAGHTFTATLITAGARTVTLGDTVLPGLASNLSLTVLPGPPAGISLSPASATIEDIQTQQYQVSAVDRYSNSLGDVTSSTSFSIGPEGACDNPSATCSGTRTGAHTVTAQYSNYSARASLTLTPGPPAEIAATVSRPNVFPSTSETITVSVADIFGNPTTVSPAPDSCRVVVTSPLRADSTSTTLYFLGRSSATWTISGKYTLEPGSYTVAVTTPGFAEGDTQFTVTPTGSPF